MKKILIIVVLGLSFIMTACSQDTDSVSENSLNLDAADEISYEDANVLEFEIVKQETTGNYYETIYKITNNSKDAIDYISADFAYYDAEGNEIDTDGRYHDCQLQSGQYALMSTYYLIDDDGGSPSQVEVTSYEYNTGGICYEVDLQEKSIDSYSYDNETDEPYDVANIIGIKMDDKGIDSIGSREIDCILTNNGDVPIEYIDFDMAFFDKEGNYICSDGRYNDDELKPGKSVKLTSFGSTDSDEEISSCKIYQIEYKLKNTDSYGNNNIEINLQTKEVTASFEDE